MLGVGREGERHEVAELEPGRPLQVIEQGFRRPDEPEVDVFGGTSALDAKLDDEPTLEHDAVAQLTGDAGEEAVEDQELTPPREVGPVGRRRPQSGLERLLERCGGGVADQAALLRARISLASSLSMSPRVRACCMAASMSSGETCAATQSSRVRRTLVTGTAPTSTRSAFGTSP